MLRKSCLCNLGFFNVFIVDRVKSQLKRLARPMYSNPPVHGARIVANVVGDPNLFSEWKAEMEEMAGRIKSVRKRLYDNLSQKDKSGKDWSFILKQIGMFSFTGLNPSQVIFVPESVCLLQRKEIEFYKNMPHYRITKFRER